MSASPAMRFARVPFKSELSDVADEAWDAFVRAIALYVAPDSTELRPRPIRHISISGGYGSFDLRPRRLAELGVLTNVRRDERGKCTGDFVPPYSETELLRNSVLQYNLFVSSVKKYDEDIIEGRVCLPDGVSRSGAHAVLHCGGRGALLRWPDGAFRTTQEVFDRTNNLF